MSASTKLEEFEVLLDDLFINHNTDKSITPDSNKSLLSIINGYEDGIWRFKKFQDFVWNNITETALSYTERLALIDQSHTSLTEAAKKLRLTDKKSDQTTEGSELAEIVLYGIMKKKYNALPVVPKIFYKQNSNDNAKGADSVHIVLSSDDDFTIWFGEAKFYNRIEDVRLNEIITSVEKSLQSEKLKKENSIITNTSDFNKILQDKKELCDRIKKMLESQKSIDHLKPKLNVPILLLHECAITNDTKELSEDYKNKIIQYHKERATAYYKKQVKKLATTLFKYESIRFHIILFPVPQKEPIVKKFLENVEHYKNQ